MNDQFLLLYRDILSDLVMDNVGLWEVGWRANVLLSSLSESDRDSVSEGVINGLLDDGLAELVDEAGTPALLPDHPLRRMWRSENPDTSLWLQATSEAVDEESRPDS